MTVNSKIEEWTKSPFDQETQNELIELKKNPEKIEDAFYKNLEFGTGGMRGIMGVGTNRINKYTLGKSTQGLSNYLKKYFPNKNEIKVVIAYDCRINSNSLSRQVAEVFSANGIQVYLFSDLRPTPELSFAVKHLNAQCGIVLTASHNPPEYNGYKVYWEDGGQIVPPHDNQIINQINKTEFSDINFTPNEELITLIDREIDEVFFNVSIELGKFEIKNRKNYKVVFTSLHGTSITAVPQVLAKAGYSQVYLVKEQSKPDGNFPTVKSPNPEEPEALKLALQEAEKQGADIVIGTDPDCDRLGIAVRDETGEFCLLNGNQTMVVMTYFLLEQWKQKDALNGKQFIASTIVSSPMISKIASSYGVGYKETLTGFKWIAKLIEDFPELEFIGGGEESFGYLVGNKVRDKDAVTATLLACEIGAYGKSIGKSFFKILEDCYREFGAYKERLLFFTQKGKEGAEKISSMMNDFRENPPKTIAGQSISYIEDYQKGFRINLKDHSREKLDFDIANVLIYLFEDGSKIAIRPSGTEPKIKFYFSTNQKIEKHQSWKEVEKELESKIDELIKAMGI
jgi:phosphoglucomutase